MNLQRTFQPILTRSTTEQSTSVSNGFNFFGVSTKKGVQVNQHSALTISAMFNGIEIITNDIAKLPMSVLRKEGKTRSKQNDHPLNVLIASRPNEMMISFMLKKMMLFDAIFRGNGYCRILRHPVTGDPTSLILIDQDETPVEVYKHQNKLFYRINGEVIGSDDMLHIPGFSTNGITGVSVITYAAHQLGIDLSSQEYASEYYKQKGMGTGVVTAATAMNDGAKQRLSTALASMFDRKENWNIPIIDEASNFHHIKITPQESQFLMVHKNGIEEVARWLNIPLFKLKSTDNVNNSITEQLSIAYVHESVQPWAIRFDQEFKTKLFSSQEIAAGYYIKSNLSVLLVGDQKTKTEYYSKGMLTGWLTGNEVRAFEDMNPIDGLDEPMRPLNMMKINESKKTNEGNE